MSASPTGDPGAGEQDARAVNVDRAWGTLVGDHGVQSNHFRKVAASRDAFVAGRDVHVHVGDPDGGVIAGITGALQPVRAAPPAKSEVFVGRDDDLAKLLRLLDPAVSGTVPRVTVVTGMPGVGKTELAVHAASAAVRNGWFPGGVLFATLQGDGLELAQTALDGFLSELRIPGDLVPADLQARSRLFSSRIAQYAEAAMSVLVVIDNAASAGQCELLLPAGGRAVVTSRNKLSILDARRLPLKVLSNEAGANLLAAQLGVSRGEDTRVADHRDDAQAVAALCGGLPLALRIVAAILADNEARPLATVVADLDDTRTRLDELRQEDGREEVGVRAAFDVSYRMLEPEQAWVFRLLALNPGPEISTAAAAVLTGLDERAVRRHLEGLAKTHLIDPGTADARWRMHDLIHIYAAEEPPDGTDDAQARLTFYYMNTAADATAHLAPAFYHPVKRTFSGRADALKWLDLEYPNLVAIALLPAPIFADVTLRLWRYFELRRRINDGIMLTSQALFIARQAGDRDREAQAHNILAMLFRQARMFDAALTAGRAAVASYSSAGDQEGLGTALENLGHAQFAAEQFEGAIQTGWDAVAIFRSLGDRYREAMALGDIAAALRATGQLEESIETFGNVLAVLQEVGDQRAEAATLNNLGYTLKDAGRLDEAIAAEKKAAAIFAEFDDRGGEGSALTNLGAFLYLQGQARESIPVLRAAVDALTDVGDAHSRAMALVNLANASAEDGHSDEAITAFTDAAADFRETQDRGGEGTAELGRGRALWAAGRPGEAADAFRAVVEISREIGDRHGEGTALGLLGSVLAENEQEEAITALKGAVAAFRETGERELQRAAMSILLSLRSLSDAAELHARIEAGAIDKIGPGIWMDVRVIDTHGDVVDDEEARRMVEEMRASVRKLASSTRGKTARKQPRKTSRKQRRRNNLQKP